MARGFGGPRTLQGFVMFALMVTLAIAVIWRIPQIRQFVTGS